CLPRFCFYARYCLILTVMKRASSKLARFNFIWNYLVSEDRRIDNLIPDVRPTNARYGVTVELDDNVAAVGVATTRSKLCRRGHDLRVKIKLVQLGHELFPADITTTCLKRLYDSHGVREPVSGNNAGVRTIRI